MYYYYFSATEPCLSSPCQNGATCYTLTSDSIKEFRCICAESFTGINCNIEIVPEGKLYIVQKYATTKKQLSM